MTSLSSSVAAAIEDVGASLRKSQSQQAESRRSSSGRQLNRMERELQALESDGREPRWRVQLMRDFESVLYSCAGLERGRGCLHCRRFIRSGPRGLSRKQLIVTRASRRAPAKAGTCSSWNLDKHKKSVWRDLHVPSFERDSANAST